MRPLILLLALAAVLLAPGTAAAADTTCTGDPTAIQRLDLSVGGQPAYGLYAFPPGTPRGMVVFGHGYTYNVDAWRGHITRAAREDGLVAVAMNYRGLIDKPKDDTGYERSRGFPVKAGGEDLVAAGQHFQDRCGGFDRRFLLGVSMGGNATGMAATQRAKTSEGRPLFDYWIGIEGVYNFRETYLEARTVQANEPREDIEKETGGTIEQKPDAYRERTLVDRAGDIAGGGLKGIVLVHGYNDGLVPYNQAQEFLRAMRNQGVPTDLYTARRKAPGDQEDDTRIPGGPADGPGHASEWAKHIVIDTGMDRLSALARRGEPPPCNRDFEVDGTRTPASSPDPSKPASGCPAQPSFSGSAARPGSTPAPVGLACEDGIRPSVSVRLRRRGGGRLLVSGRTSDRDCTRESGTSVPRVSVAVARKAGSRCRFLRRSGRESRPRSCSRRRIFLRPTGRTRYSLPLRSLRRGSYRIAVVATDPKGNRGTAVRSVRVR